MSVGFAAPGQGAAPESERGPAMVGPVSFRWASDGLIAGLNHLLDQQPWARDRLRMHAGRVVELTALMVTPFGAGLPALRLAIDRFGSFEPADPKIEPAVRMKLRLSVDAGFAWMRDGPIGLQKFLSIEGDVLLAAAMAELAQALRWDWEDDLSRLVGDAAAHRTGQTARALHARLSGLASGLLMMWSARIEQGEATVIGRIEWEIFQDERSELEAQLSVLEQRVSTRL